MSGKKNAAPVCETVSGSRQICFEDMDQPGIDNITEFAPRQGSVASLLLRGRENAQTAMELARISGLDRREVCRLIQQERLEGAPILSSGHGYFLPADAEDLRRCVSGLWSRIREQIRTVNAMGQLADGGE